MGSIQEIGRDRLVKIKLDSSPRMIVLTNGSNSMPGQFSPRLFARPHNHNSPPFYPPPPPRSIVIQTSILRSNFRQISRAIEFKRLSHRSKLVVKSPIVADFIKMATALLLYLSPLSSSSSSSRFIEFITQ